MKNLMRNSPAPLNLYENLAQTSPRTNLQATQEGCDLYVSHIYVVFGILLLSLKIKINLKTLK